MLRKILLKILLCLVIVIALISCVVGYYCLRWPYQLKYAEQTSFSTRIWEPLKILIESEPNEAKEEQLAIDVEAFRGNWKKVQELTQNDEGSTFKAYYHNLSLAYQGMLADSLLHHFAPFDDALFLPLLESTGYAKVLSAGEAWWACGDLTFAEHATMLGMIFSPRHTGTRAMMRLTQINIATGDSAAAAKYIRMLKKTPQHRRWAEKMEERLPGLQLKEEKDIVRLRYHYQESLRNVLDNNPQKDIAHEYLLCLDLLIKDLIGFKEDVEKYGLTHTSRLYEEALLILMMNDLEMNQRWKNQIDNQTYADFSQFNALMQKDDKAALKRNFGHTYWYHYLYVEKNKS